jgi:8-oxo-dGTP pyrophosphatase MutT (NUDIX family)
MTKEKRDPRVHFAVVTGIVVKKNKFLIMKRAAHEKAFPGMWTVPGGKLVYSEYGKLPYKTKFPQWYNVVEWVLRKEIREEANIEIKKPEYLCDLVFVRPDGFPVLTLSYWAHYKSGMVKIGKDLTDFAWVTLKEAKTYDLIPGIWDELHHVEKILKKKKTA